MPFDVSQGKKGTIKWRMDPEPNKAWAGDVACCGVNNRGVALWKDKVISSRSMVGSSPPTRQRVKRFWNARSPIPPSPNIDAGALDVRDVAIVVPPAAEFGIRGFIDGTDLNTGQGLWRTYTIPGAGEPA